MIRKIRWYWVLLLFLVSFFLSIGNANASIEGCWKIKGKANVTVNVKGEGTYRDKTRFKDELCFYEEMNLNTPFCKRG